MIKLFFNSLQSHHHTMVDTTATVSFFATHFVLEMKTIFYDLLVILGAQQEVL